MCFLSLSQKTREEERLVRGAMVSTAEPSLGRRAHPAAAQRSSRAQPRLDVATMLSSLLDTLRDQNTVQPDASAAQTALDVCAEISAHLQGVVAGVTTLDAQEQEIAAGVVRKTRTPSQSHAQIPRTMGAERTESHLPLPYPPFSDGAGDDNGSEVAGPRGRMRATHTPAGMRTRHESSIYSARAAHLASESGAGATLPILLPSKLDWVRMTHIRMGIPSSDALQKAGMRRIPSLPSERFFGLTDEWDADKIYRTGGKLQHDTSMACLISSRSGSRISLQEARERQPFRHRPEEHAMLNFDRLGRFHHAM